MPFFRLLVVTVLMWAPIRAVGAQPTNMQLVEQLVVECISGLPLPGELKIEPDVRYESVSNAVVGYLRGRDIRVFETDRPESDRLASDTLASDTLASDTLASDTLASDTLATSAPRRQALGYRVEDVRVSYARAGREYGRTVTAVVAPRLVSETGEILHAGRCDRSIDDIVGRSEITRIERGAPDEARAELPPAGFRRRVAEPLLLAGATAVSVVLFFTLRSKRSTSE